MNSNQSQPYTLKRSSSEDSFSGKSTMFVPAKVAQVNPKTQGVEYRQDVTDDAQYIKKIFDTNNYEHDQESLLDFYSDVYYIMDSNETSDKRNIGAIMGMASLGVLGFLTFGITLVGGLAGIIFGGTLGRMIAAKVANLRRKKEMVTQEDLYILKARCVAELGIKQKKKAKFDLNKFRLCLEKVVEESSLTLETSVFQKPKVANDIRFRLRNLLMDPQSQLAFLLSYRLFKTFLQRSDMENPTNLEKAAKKIYAVYLPFVRFIELVEIPSQAKDNPSLVAYFKIKAYISRPELVDLLARYPEYKTTLEVLESFRDFLKQEVDTTGPMKRAMTTDNRQPISEQIPLKKSFSPSKSIGENPSEQVLQRANEDDSIASYPSTKNFNFDELCEGVSAYNANLYVSGKKTRYGQLPSLSNFNSAQKDLTLNFSHSHSHTNNVWNNMPEIEKTTSNILYKKPRTDQSDSIPDVVSATKQKTQQTEENKAKEYIMLEAKSPEQSRSQDRSHMISAIQLEQVESPMSKVKKQPSVVNTPNKDDSPTNKEALEAPDDDKLLQNSVGGNVQNKVIFDKVLSIGYDNTSKWDRVVNNPIIRIDKIKPEGSPVVLIRAWADIKGYSPEEVFQQIYDTENRAKWDTVTVNLNVVEDIDAHTAIIHFVVKAPIGISDRDFVQRRIFQKDYPEKGTITMGFQSFEHPKRPPVKGRVRGETHIAGYILKPSAKDPNSTDMCILTQVDIKGSIPKIIVNMAAGKAPAEWVNKMIKACERARNDKRK